MADTLIIKGFKAEVAKPIMAVSGAVEKKNTIPILANILIRKTGQKVTFTGSDEQIEVTSDAAIGVGDEDFATTVSAAKLCGILSTIADDAEVSIFYSDNHVIIKSGRTKFDLQTIDAEQYPIMKEQMEFQYSFAMPCMKFKNMLAMVQFAAAVNNVRYFLNGVYVSAENNIVRTVGTDGHRLSLFQNELDEPFAGKCEAILPKKTARELLRLIPDTEEMLKISISEKQIKVHFANIDILSKLIEGKYPDYERVIPTKNDKEFLVDREQLIKTLQRVAILSMDKVRNVRWTLSEDRLVLATTNADMEEAIDEIEIDYKGEPMEIIFNISYLLDMLAVVKTEKIRFSLSGPLSSGLVRVPDSENFKFVVMPVRI